MRGCRGCPFIFISVSTPIRGYIHETLIRMTHDELIAKAVEHAKRTGIAVELLHRPRVREAVIVSFTSPHSSGKAKFYLDAATGDFISGEFSATFILASPRRQTEPLDAG